MTWLSRLLRRNRVEAQLDAELRDHLERQVADYVTSGMSEPAARRRAAIELGGVEQVKELCRDARGTRWIENLLQDLRYGVRLCNRNASFTIAAVLSLALGVGANTAIFTLLDAVILKPLPVEEPDRLVEPHRSRRPAPRQRLQLPVASILPRACDDSRCDREPSIHVPRRAGRRAAGDQHR